MGRPGSCLLCLAIGLLLLSVFANYSYSQTGVGADINSTLAYVNMVNQSAYVVFYPNMTAAYGYISKAENVSRTDPAYARSLLAQAMGSAQQQLDRISQYRTDSVLVLAVVAVALVVLLNRLMRVRRGKTGRRQK